MTAIRGLFVVRLLGALADGVMLPFVVLWASQEAGLSGTTAGLLFIAQAVGELVGGLGGGALADRFGHRRALLASTAGMALGYGALCVLHQPVLGIACFLIAGLFESAFHPTIAALIADLSKDEDLHRAFGLNRIAANLGGIVGPLLGAAAAAISLSSVFLVAGVLLVIAVVVLLGTIPVRSSQVAAVEVVDGSPVGAILRDRRLGLMILAGGLLVITMTWFEADGLVLLRRQHPLSVTAYAALFTVAAIATVALQLPISRWAAKRSLARSLGLGAVVQGSGLALLAFGRHGYAVLVVAALLIALGQMLYGPAAATFASRAAGPGRQATYQAAISTSQDIGMALGPVSGLAFGHSVAPGVIWLAALPLNLAAGTAAIAATRTRIRPESISCKD